MNTDIDKIKAPELSKEEKLSLAMKQGNKPSISPQRMDANRWQLKKILKAERYKQHSIVGRFSFLLASNKLQIVGMFLTFSFGFLVASSDVFLKSLPQHNSNKVALNKNETNYLNRNDQIVNFEIYENENGKPFNVNYTTVRRTSLDANLEDDRTVSILAAAMKSDLDDATRLRLIGVLKDHLDNKAIRESLSHSLLFDPNPGVRIVAAESLAKLSNNQKIRETLRQALIKDTNQGVRISAFNGLLEHLDEKTIEIFKAQGAKDGNFYIRNKAQDIITESQLNSSLEQSI